MDQPEAKEQESPEIPEGEKRESRRSMVRVYVTYAAAIFLFGGGALLVTTLFITGRVDDAKDLFLAIMPVSAAVISYWFATRRPASAAGGGDTKADERQGGA